MRKQTELIDKKSGMHRPVAVQPTGSLSYVLLTAAYNEEASIERVIDSVIAQTWKPKEWVIVDDGSTDRTLEIATYRANDWPFIHVVSREKASSVGHNWAARVNAINHGYSCLRTTQYDFIGILDADITFEAAYYERVINRLLSRSAIGVAGGNLHERKRGEFAPRSHSRSFHVPGAIQLFRRECYEQVGGLRAYRGGHDDTVAEITARMYGWKSQSFSDILAFHHRPTGITGTSAFRARYSEGATQYLVGYDPVFQLFSSLARINTTPFLLAAAARLAGYWISAIRREQRVTSPEFIRYLRSEQMARIKSLFRNSWNSDRLSNL